MDEEHTQEQIKETVREHYGAAARRYVDVAGGGSCGCTPAPKSPAQPCCCTPAPQAPAGSCCCAPAQGQAAPEGAARLYSAEDLAGLPESVTEISLGCGNPIALAELKPGEVVLDLGSGGGIDCFLAAQQVGPAGRVIGLDMTPEMLKLARRNARQMGVTNVHFEWGEMEEIPLPDQSVDVILSNCVINLSPDKDAVFHEAYRVLRPGGRMSISDIVIDGQLPAAIRRRLDAWAGCLAGALDEGDYLAKIRAAGFEQVEVISRDYGSFDDDSGELAALLAEAGLTAHDMERKVASVKVRAVKSDG